MKVRMRPTPARIKDDLDTIFVAIDRLRVLGDVGPHDWKYTTRRRDLALANRALIALANVRERIEYSVPVEQGEMEGMAVHASGDSEQDSEVEDE